MIACITFDFDGTLVDSNLVKVQSFYKIVENYDPSGCTVTEVLQRCSHKDRYGITRELAREFMAKGLIPPHTGTEVLGLQWAETYHNHLRNGRCRVSGSPWGLRDTLMAVESKDSSIPQLKNAGQSPQSPCDPTKPHPLFLGNIRSPRK